MWADSLLKNAWTLSLLIRRDGGVSAVFGVVGFLGLVVMWLDRIIKMAYYNMTQYFIKLEMIYLHHQSLANIIGNKERICANDKLIIHTYRHTLLTQFCQNHNLSIPIYDKYNNGKPYCQNIPSLAFNHSHSQNNYTLIYGLNIKNIGVDIEYFR